MLLEWDCVFLVLSYFWKWDSVLFWQINFVVVVVVVIFFFESDVLVYFQTEILTYFKADDIVFISIFYLKIDIVCAFVCTSRLRFWFISKLRICFIWKITFFFQLRSALIDHHRLRFRFLKIKIFLEKVRFYFIQKTRFCFILALISYHIDYMIMWKIGTYIHADIFLW